jgi:hypothetical protein
LLSSGVLLLVAGAIAGLVAKRSADIASYVASQPTRLVSDPSNFLALTFDPTSAHHVPPDYAGFWLGMTVGALGLTLIVVGIVVRVAGRPTA